ncbi:hypothetical protein POM88_033159 [Heracleum sosnowskyi]|uniref:Uncharacterized protein n=1 Tax=Heracleum sosnowskyi TaxID=360622 RepID=A0AAD8MKS1_9APIA|nr:hypothetical protein POM88_033136 [Heracleum sosnowskyi]KAK1376946.1 hypothetical protein POM88_033139 [Heracleum sosnowskyi]KAK1376950.1 hypothetical protein POM88_033143 [Heracleum sosnowskyi]KAK1376954.1 hypothetical protein POM88_033147 [Heracleum sosnowskyi]KAK1376960.1 hypothetical protein POM88_033153 [Heracleum sosnowskyi]
MCFISVFQFGRNWFDPLDACALRAKINPIIAEELKVDGYGWNIMKRPVFEGENIKGDVNVPERNVNVPERNMKLRRNVRTVGRHLRKRKDVHFNQSRTGFKDNLFHFRIKVLWEEDKKYYNSVIVSFNTLTKQHQVKSFIWKMRTGISFRGQGALLRMGIRSVTVSDVKCFGDQCICSPGSSFSADMLVSKIKMEMVVSKNQVEEVIQNIIVQARHR